MIMLSLYPVIKHKTRKEHVPDAAAVYAERAEHALRLQAFLEHREPACPCALLHEYSPSM